MPLLEQSGDPLDIRNTITIFTFSTKLILQLPILWNIDIKQFHHDGWTIFRSSMRAMMAPTSDCCSPER